MYFYVLTSVPQCPAPLSGLLWLSSLALRVLLSSAWLLLGPGESLFSTPFLASPLIGTTSGWRDQRTPQKPHAPEWKQRNIRIRGWKWQNMTMFTDANSQSLSLIFNTILHVSAHCIWQKTEFENFLQMGRPLLPLSTPHGYIQGCHQSQPSVGRGRRPSSGPLATPWWSMEQRRGKGSRERKRD